jgi:hypothetical protein
VIRLVCKCYGTPVKPHSPFVIPARDALRYQPFIFNKSVEVSSVVVQDFIDYWSSVNSQYAAFPQSFNNSNVYLTGYNKPAHCVSQIRELFAFFCVYYLDVRFLWLPAFKCLRIQ